ncbi:MAG: hypothetical protein ACTS3F_09400 [Phycisphaerales bacterium]
MAGTGPRQIADRVADGVKSRGLSWLRTLRLKVLAYTIAIPLAAWGAIALTPAWAALPIVGVAVAAVTMTVNKMTQRLGRVTCWTCGADLSGSPEFVVGVICDACGAVNQHRPATAKVPADEVQAWATLAAATHPADEHDDDHNASGQGNSPSRTA